MQKRYITLFLIVLLFSIILIGCGSNETTGNSNSSTEQTNGSSQNSEATSQSDSSTPQSNKLTIYTAFPEQEAAEYIDQFKKETGIDVVFVRLSAGQIAARVSAEKNNPQASVWYGGPSDTFVAAANEGLLEAYQPNGQENVPQELTDESWNYTPIYVGALGFALNSDWFEKNNIEHPQSWSDLLKPEFKGQITMAHPASSGTAYTVLATLVQMLGEEEAFNNYLLKLDANMLLYTQSGSAPAMQAGLGETVIGIAFAHDILAPIGEGYPITLGFPKDGTGYEVGAVSLIKNGPAAEQENAKKFIDWTISKGGQSLYAESGYYRLPIHPEATVPDKATPLKDLDIIDYDAVWAGEQRDHLISKFEAEIRGRGDAK